MAVITIDYFSNALCRSTTFKLLLPECSPEETASNPHYNRPMKTVYLLHGYSGIYTDWPLLTNITDLAAQYNLAVVCPNGDNSFYLDGPETGHGYCTFVGEELPLYVQKLFGLSAAKEDNYIGGMSMGGYGALHAAFAYPERFDAVASFSAALIQHEIETMQPGYDNGMANYAYYRTVFGEPEGFSHSPNNPDYQVAQLLAQGQSLPRIFLCIGAEDPLVYDANQLFRKFLTEKNVDFTYVEAPGVHDFRFADRQLEKALQFLTGEVV